MRRRELLLGLMALSGCGGQLFTAATDDPGPPFALPGASRLRIAIFEIRELSFPFHAGVIIHSPEERIIYDPGGYWHHPQARRIRDVTHGLTPELEEHYMSRGALQDLPWSWRWHLFETEVPDDVARDLVARARTREVVPPGFCVPGTVTLLRHAPGFEGLPMSLLPGVLLAALRARDDLAYSRQPASETSAQALPGGRDRPVQIG